MYIAQREGYAPFPLCYIHSCTWAQYWITAMVLSFQVWGQHTARVNSTLLLSRGSTSIYMYMICSVWLLLHYKLQAQHHGPVAALQLIHTISWCHYSNSDIMRPKFRGVYLYTLYRGLTEGFRIGFNRQTTQLQGTWKNHPSALAHPEIVSGRISEKI